ncbi:MAG TPA: ImmA/IrrE family metallo-endopeptidase [Candidatus Saccharimonadales bacterium]
MSPQDHYRQAREKANEIRNSFNLTGARIMVSDLKKIYKQVGIDKVEYHDGFKGTALKGAYFNDEAGVLVMINKKLIKITDPKVFTLAHELKHHLLDDVAMASLCTDNNEATITERAANIFATELIYPTELFVEHVKSMQIIGDLKPEHIVSLKHRTNTTLSHAGIAIRAERLNLGSNYKDVKWLKLRDKMYPEYARFKRIRSY